MARSSPSTERAIEVDGAGAFPAKISRVGGKWRDVNCFLVVLEHDHVKKEVRCPYHT
jgi:hypothetical protein